MREGTPAPPAGVRAVTDDRTEFQQDREASPAIPAGPRAKWKWQRGMAAASFACAALYPFAVIGLDSSVLLGLAPHWYLFHGGVVGVWFGGSTIAGMRK